MPQPSDEPTADPTGSRASARAAVARRFAAPLVIAAVGIVVVIATDDTAEIIGWGVFAIAVVVAISLVFLEIGYSEDRAREREQAARRGG